jgi:hypothetical protein
MMPLITAGPAGTTGYAEGRPKVRPLLEFWPCLIRRELVEPKIHLLPAFAKEAAPTNPPPPSPGERVGKGAAAPRRVATSTREQTTNRNILADIALARSGDKGRHANIGVIARDPSDFPRLQQQLSAARVAAFLGVEDAGRVQRFELPNLGALNFIVHDILSSKLRLDSQGKGLGQVLLQMPLSKLDADT